MECMGYSSRSRSSLLRIGVSASVSLRKPNTKIGITNEWLFCRILFSQQKKRQLRTFWDFWDWDLF